VASIDAPLQCWSYWCVCSENTPGRNFLDGTALIEQCVRGNCSATETPGAIGAALSVFQSVCRVEYMCLFLFLFPER